VSLGPLPTGYQYWTGRGSEGFAWGPARDALEALWREGPSVYAWAERQPNRKELVGRGPVQAVPAALPGPDARPRWAVRRYRRGGMASALLRDRYVRLGAPRPLRELAASVHARAEGVNTPAVVGCGVYVSPWFYRADLVTELIPHARTLDNEVFHAGVRDAARAERALVGAGHLVRSLARAGVLHVDLNAANILLDREDSAWVVDLDRGRVSSRGERRMGAAMLERLERSLRKLSAVRGVPVRRGHWECLHAGFDQAR